MRFVTYINKDDEKHLGIMTSDQKEVIAVDSIIESAEIRQMTDLIAKADEEKMKVMRNAAESGRGTPMEDIELLSPIIRPIHDVLCVGVNYAEHLEETRRSNEYGDFQKKPEKTIYFSKRAFEIIGPEADIIARPDLDAELDYEVELAVIIGKTCKDVKPEDAEDVIFGYSVFNDLSSRKLQREHKQWMRGKGIDTYTAMGPCILTKDELPFPVEVDVISRVNGEVRQHSNTRMMLNDISGIIADLSAGTTLEPGDIIATGTPSGVAMGMKEPAFLKAGDTVIVEIPEIGCLTNYVK